MAYDSGWVLPRLRRPGPLWGCASALAVSLLGLITKIYMVFLNSPTVFNRAALQRALARPRGVPLLTVANHHSCFDDPGLWGVLLDWASLRWSRVRWTLTAHDVCFTDVWAATGFALGKCVPVVRGAGVYQPAIDFCIERLCRGEWVHLFPEGRVNERKEHIRLKWGVGRLVAGAGRLEAGASRLEAGASRLEAGASRLEAGASRLEAGAGRLEAGAGRPAEGAHAPMVLPVWHEGLDLVLPNDDYRFRVGQRVFINVGEPIQLDYLFEGLKKTNASEEETRKAITDVIQDELLRLRDDTHARIRRELGARAGPLLGARADVRVRPRPRDPAQGRPERGR